MKVAENPVPRSAHRYSRSKKIMISVVVPDYNEEAIIEQNLNRLSSYLDTLRDRYRWEMIIVDDGSQDQSGLIADRFASIRKNVQVYHHFANMQLGRSLQTAFQHCQGDYVVTMDLDLSYSPDHIERLLEKIIATQAQIVIASPYMKGGRVSNVPWKRRLLSKCANKFLSLSYKGNIHTITGMVRAYERKFIRSLNLKATDMECNAEILYKAQLLRAKVIEVPAHLDWGLLNTAGKKRQSSMRTLRGIGGSLMAGFIFRPFMYFIVPGIILLLISIYIIVWIFINTMTIYPETLATSPYFDDQFSNAVAAVYKARPHAFFVGGSTLLAALQLLSLGILSLQSKRYFEELFHFSTTLYKQQLETLSGAGRKPVTRDLRKRNDTRRRKPLL